MKNKLAKFLFFVIWCSACTPNSKIKFIDSTKLVDCSSINHIRLINVSNLIEVNESTLELTSSSKENLQKTINLIDQCGLKEIKVLIYYRTNFRYYFDESLTIASNIKVFIEKCVVHTKKITWTAKYLKDENLAKLDKQQIILKVLK